jgi:hypothetical protein
MPGKGLMNLTIFYYSIQLLSRQVGVFVFRAVFWVILPCKMIVDRHGSITKKTALNIILAAVRT